MPLPPSHERTSPSGRSLSRRGFLGAGAAGVAGSMLARCAAAAAKPVESIRAGASAESAESPAPAEPSGEPTRFQIACMTLPYSAFSFERALAGIKSAGYRYVAWGTTHVGADGQRAPILAADAPPARAAEIARQCRDAGLEPLMMFSMIYPENPQAIEVLTSRIRQAAAADRKSVV